MRPFRGNAGQQRVGQIDDFPIADAVAFVRRYVGREERAERRLQPVTAAETQRIGLARRHVTGRTTADEEYEAPALGVAALFVGAPIIARIERARRREKPTDER